MRQQANQHHLFVADDVTDVRGAQFCATCGLPEANRLHQLPDRDEAERAAELRRMGEVDGDQ